MNKTQTETANFEAELNELINNHRSPYLTHASLIGVLYMAMSDMDKEASGLPVDGRQLDSYISGGM